VNALTGGEIITADYAESTTPMKSLFRAVLGFGVAATATQGLDFTPQMRLLSGEDAVEPAVRDNLMVLQEGL